LDEDHAALQAIVDHSKWVLLKARRPVAARNLLRHYDISVVLCEHDLGTGTWTEVLEHASGLSRPPSLIVTSRLADERLWAEALNLGAWDVLAKPFDAIEVIRSVQAGWQHRRNLIQFPARDVRTLRSAG
jgi:DNA-binding response OmpR family regulator